MPSCGFQLGMGKVFLYGQAAACRNKTVCLQAVRLEAGLRKNSKTKLAGSVPSNGWRNTPTVRNAHQVDKTSTQSFHAQRAFWYLASLIAMFAFWGERCCLKLCGLAVWCFILIEPNKICDYFCESYMYATRLTIFHCALSLRMRASGPANAFSRENCFV